MSEVLSPERERELLAQTQQLEEAFRVLIEGKETSAVLTALSATYGRVLSYAFANPESFERALVKLTTILRGWWIADRGGPFMSS